MHADVAGTLGMDHVHSKPPTALLLPYFDPSTIYISYKLNENCWKICISFSSYLFIHSQHYQTTWVCRSIMIVNIWIHRGRSQSSEWSRKKIREFHLCHANFSCTLKNYITCKHLWFKILKKNWGRGDQFKLKGLCVEFMKKYRKEFIFKKI